MVFSDVTRLSQYPQQCCDGPVTYALINSKRSLAFSEKFSKEKRRSFTSKLVIFICVIWTPPEYNGFGFLSTPWSV